MARIGTENSVPSCVPGATLTPADIARVTPEDWAEIGKLARGYCRTVDGTRSRKRMDGSATVVGAPYGTDDISDDVNQDAVLLFAQRLRDVVTTCATTPDSGATRETQAWVYVKRDGNTMIITRTTLQRWAVRDAAARNGYRTDMPAEETDATAGAQFMRGLPRVESVVHATVVFAAAGRSAEIFRQAFGDGSEFPMLKRAIRRAEQAENLARTGVLADIAQERYGGVYGSRRAVIRTRDAARAEFRELSERLDEARDALVYAGTEAERNH